MADNKTFIRLNGFDVKDQKARDYIDSFKSLLGYEGDPNDGEKLTRIDNLDYYVNDLKELLGYVDANPGPDGVLGTEDDESSKISRVDKIQQKVDNIAEELGFKMEGDKAILDRLIDLETKVEQNSGNTDSKFEGVQDQFEEVQEQINAIHKHDNLDILNDISQDDIDNWNDKSFDGLEGTEDVAFIKDIPTKLNQLENAGDPYYYSELDIVEQEMIEALIATFEQSTEPPEDEEPSEEPAPPPEEDPEKPLEPDYPYIPDEDIPEEYGINLIKNGKFKNVSGNSVPYWTFEGNIQIDNPVYQEVSEYFTLILMDKTQSHIKQRIEGMQKNTVYTLSYDITWESAVSNYTIYVRYYDAGENEVHVNEMNEMLMGHKFHIITNPDIDFNYVVLDITVNGLTEYSSEEANMFLCSFKLEEGFEETAWSEHPDLV